MQEPMPQPSTFDSLAAELRKRLQSDHSRLSDVVEIVRRLPGFEGHLRAELEGSKEDASAPEVPLDRLVMRFGTRVVSFQLGRFLGQGRSSRSA